MSRIGGERRSAAPRRDTRCVNERKPSGRVKLPGGESKTVEKFKHFGSTVQSHGGRGAEVRKCARAGWDRWQKTFSETERKGR